jgi:hypothetical protein
MLAMASSNPLRERDKPHLVSTALLKPERCILERVWIAGSRKREENLAFLFRDPIVLAVARVQKAPI